ncbi:MAG TPA: VOC family protein [Solirubrobacteraceae bacterium]|nr:VOC family protein [Solirubrobacteraceae bacterium]
MFRRDSISYLHIPARDIARSSEFYAAVFSWAISPESQTFSDGSGHVIGRWVTDQEPVGDDGIRPYICVDSVQETLDKAQANGGETATPPYPEGNLTVATVRDPAGNTIGIWTQAATS